MPDIFLSYAEEDRETARRIAGLLEANGWSVWWDRKIPIGRTWRSVLEEALGAMRCMIVLWSESSVKSQWVYEEAEEGNSLGKLVPVLIERVKPPLGLRGIQAADFIGWDGATDAPGVRQLISDLETKLGSPPVTAQGTRDAPDQRRHFADRARSWFLGPFAIGVVAVLIALLVFFWPDDKRPAPVVRPIDKRPNIELANPPQNQQTETPRKSETIVDSPVKPIRTYPSGASKKVRCEDIVTRWQLGEPLSDSDRLFLRRECRNERPN